MKKKSDKLKNILQVNLVTASSITGNSGENSLNIRSSDCILFLYRKDTLLTLSVLAKRQGDRYILQFSRHGYIYA